MNIYALVIPLSYRRSTHNFHGETKELRASPGISTQQPPANIPPAYKVSANRAQILKQFRCNILLSMLQLSLSGIRGKDATITSAITGNGAFLLAKACLRCIILHFSPTGK